jgi:hypothetical protein
MSPCESLERLDAGRCLRRRRPQRVVQRPPHRTQRGTQGLSHLPGPGRMRHLRTSPTHRGTMGHVGRQVVRVSDEPRKRGRPRTRPDTPEIQRDREQQRRRYYGLPPLPPLPRNLSREQLSDPLADARRRSERHLEHRLEVQRLLGEYKLKMQCQDCDRVFDKPHHLDFDHLPGNSKVFNLSKAGRRPWDAIWQEVSKCEVVCALCHRDRTLARSTADPDYGRHNLRSNKLQAALWEEADHG